MRCADSRIALTAAAAFWLMLMLPVEAFSQRRTVHGKVVSGGELLRGAVVQLKNVRTLEIRSYITQKDGGYHFTGLNPDLDYELSATYRGRSSAKRTISQFSSKDVIEIDLEIRER